MKKFNIIWNNFPLSHIIRSLTILVPLMLSFLLFSDWRYYSFNSYIAFLSLFAMIIVTYFPIYIYSKGLINVRIRDVIVILLYTAATAGFGYLCTMLFYRSFFDSSISPFQVGNISAWLFLLLLLLFINYFFHYITISFYEFNNKLNKVFSLFTIFQYKRLIPFFRIKLIQFEYKNEKINLIFTKHKLFLVDFFENKENTITFYEKETIYSEDEPLEIEVKSDFHKKLEQKIALVANLLKAKSNLFDYLTLFDEEVKTDLKTNKDNMLDNIFIEKFSKIKTLIVTRMELNTDIILSWKNIKKSIKKLN